ncbi:MAG: AAA family ATPase [Alphaproteobacteria bacterium]|nr:AAA family ATPase [Alphaproteobacteria bacterium]
MDIAEWLRGLGLAQYEPAFRENAIDASVLPSLTIEDLRDLGVTLIGHRRRLLEAIAALSVEPSLTASPTVTSVGAGPLPPPQEGAGGVGAMAERRQLTVMFCDLVGSTALAARLDPEDLREVIGTYHAAIAEVIGRFDGFVAKYMGDGVLAYFGYPQAHEDDAERAVRAGLAVVDMVRRLQTTSPLQLRVGLATGVAVVGDLIGEGSAQEQSVIGETPNLAARLQALAAPDAVVIADNTRRLVGSLFEYRSLGEVELKGLPAPVPAFRVLGESRVGSRFEALRSRETPLVGREEQLELLRQRWEQAKAGAGRVVLISAGPGIGKSRLTEAFGEGIETEPHTRLRYFCSPHRQDSALFPFIGQVEHAAGFERDDAPAARLNKLEALIAANTPVEGDVQSLADLLGLSLDNRYPALDVSPQRRKEKTYEALLRQAIGLAKRQPVLMVFEDLHWADPSSRDLLDLIVERIERMPVLLIATFRPEFQVLWADRPQITTVSLRRLGRDESGRLIHGLIRGARNLSSEVLNEIIDRTDGVPLFLEELTKAVLENAGVGTVPATSPSVPATLHASLMARLDRLGPIAKEIAQAGAAIGRDFSYELLAAAAQRTEPELRDGLNRLVDAGLVFQRGAPPQATFLFNHTLVRDTAYSMLLRAPRRALHARIAQVLEESFPTLAERQPEFLAHHFTEAGLPEKAVEYWCRAGRQSEVKGALVEAIAQLRRGLRLVAELPSTSGRAGQELELQIALAGALRSVKGFWHPEVAEAFGRAHSLVLESGKAGTISHFSVLFGLFGTRFHGGDPRAAIEHASEFLSLAQSGSDAGILVAGYQILGLALITVGDYPAGFSLLERGAELYGSEKHQILPFHIASDPGVTMLGSWAWGLWHQGYPDRSSRLAREVLRYARRPDAHPYHSLGLALHILGMITVTARQVSEAEAFGSEAVALGNELGLATLSGCGLILQGWAQTQRGANGGAAARIGDGLTLAGLRSYKPIFLGMLAETLALTGKLEDGLTVIGEALVTAEASGARGNDAELHRLRGDLLQRLPNPDRAEAEACFCRAVSIAREQGTRGFELRAAVSLARLWSEQGRRAAARELLAPVYGWFTEGFGTPDLKAAKALLDELG